jgi:hypothetical protein
MVVIHVIVSVVLMSLEWKRSKDTIDSTVNAVLSLGIYCILTFYEFKARLMIIVLCIAGLVIAVRITDLVMRYRNDPDKKLLKNKTLTDSKVVLSLSLAVIMIFCGYNRLFGPALMYSSPDSIVDSEETFEKAVYSNMSTIRKLQKDRWKTLNAQERLNVMQCLCDLESIKLGVSNCSIKVGVGDTKEDTYGYYVHEQNVIVISSDLLMHGEPANLCNTISHETYHCYQQQLAELYSKTDSKYQSLMIFDHVAQYAYEINKYNDGNKDYDGYYSQELESDARKYGRQEQKLLMQIAENGYIP